MIIDIKGAEASITSTASNFSGARLIKINATAAATVVTLTTAADAAIGTTTLLAGTHLIAKSPTDKIACAPTINGTPVGFAN
jgi:hypothetical protein|tara:strand:- start:38 stop:283 length:246 start_codon:yes stop_codon:yes gene_type:complete